MLTVYLDESDQESSEHVVVAGFVGTEDQWSSFIPDWRSALGPQRKALHMCELRWSKPRIHGLLARLGPVPYSHGLKPAVGAVRVSDYADLLTNPVEELFGSGYICALYPIIVGVLQSFPESEHIKWVFEEQTRFEPLVRSVFENFTQLKCQERLVGVEFVAKDST